MKVLFYKDEQGVSPVFEFIKDLPTAAERKVFHAIRPLEEFGLGTHIIGVKKLKGTPLWEIRVLGKDNVRLFFVVLIQDIVLLLHGFVKKTQKTPTKEMRISMNRLAEWKTRHPN